jgi:hypothetical protein
LDREEKVGTRIKEALTKIFKNVTGYLDTCTDQVTLTAMEDRETSRHTDCITVNITVNAFRLPTERNRFLLFQLLQTRFRKTPKLLFNGYLDVSWPEREIDHSFLVPKLKIFSFTYILLEIRQNTMCKLI